ncbi:hypothetical protein A4A49_43589 [Nicotiana attenuata]|uniref:Uncharacterized protein n=1 Tax=Nicotiana attenuata TaxID=49451 RepID=A0A1J6K779_NICAT|nr:hypothetical protein A4A49_62541 [Nicotiana attenuata]OIT18739.1 hypothetical protein A4A49_43589 [Nicotiana attenuata]
MGYATRRGFYYQDPKIKNFVYVDSDAQLLNIVSNLENEDKLHLYIQHIILDPEVVDDVAPTRLIGGREIGLSEVNGASGETNIEEREEVAAETEVRQNVVDESEVREEVAAETEEREEVAAESEVRENVVDESEVREDVAAETEVREEVDAKTEVREDNVTDLDGAISDLDSSSGERVVSYGTKVVKDTGAVNNDLGFKPPGLKFKGRNAIITSQLQQLSANKRSQIGSSATTSLVASPAPRAP